MLKKQDFIGLEASRIQDIVLSGNTVLESLGGSRYPMIDTHVHVVNFLQETSGLQNLISHMDETNIQKAVVFWLPVTKQWSEHEREAPEYYLDDDSACYYYSATDSIVAEEYRKLDPANQARLYPLICGFNPTDRHAIKHIERMYTLYPNVWSGIGEIFLRHDDLTLLTSGDIPRINNKVLYPIFEFADSYGLPVSVHNNISTTWVADRPKYLHELEEILREFPRVNMIFCHCGISRRVYAPFYKKMIERLLLQYPCLHIDYSWIIFDEIICKDGIPDPDWIELTERFSTRILIGSDVIGNFHKIGVINHRYDTFLSQLSNETRENICTGNAERLFSRTKGVVERGEKRGYVEGF